MALDLGSRTCSSCQDFLAPGPAIEIGMDAQHFVDLGPTGTTGLSAASGS